MPGRGRPSGALKFARAPLQAVSLCLLLAAFAIIAAYDPLRGHLLLATTPVIWAAFVLAVTALARNRHSLPRRSGWFEATAAIAAMALGDSVTLLVGRSSQSTFVSNAFFLLAYACGAVAMLRIMRQWARMHQVSVLIDSLTMLSGVGTVIASILWSHARQLDFRSDPTLLLFPILDLLLVAVVARYWFSPGGRLRAVQILCGAIFALVLAHLAMLFATVNPEFGRRWTQLWLVAFVGIAAAVAHPSAPSVSQSSPDDDAPISLLQALSLTISVGLPSAVLFGFGFTGMPVPWLPVSLGGLISAGLVGTRLALLIRSIQAKTERISQLAHSDSLTGAANRRHWDLQLEAALQEGIEHWVLILDLDHFKDYNDSHGHLAGDELLKNAVLNWRTELPDNCLLARYGGEEFTVLLDARPEAEVRQIADELRAALPAQQTCSIGIARAVVGSVQDAVLRAADLALYEAKRRGRDQAVFYRDLIDPSGARPVEGPSDPQVRTS